MMRNARTVRAARCLLIALAATLGSAGAQGEPRHADGPKHLTPEPQSAPITPDVTRAIEELLGQYHAYRAERALSTELRCELPLVWSFLGRIEAAAAWVGRFVESRGWRFTSEDQLRYSYAFTAVSSERLHAEDFIGGGLIEAASSVTVFLERCHPPEPAP